MVLSCIKREKYDMDYVVISVYNEKNRDKIEEGIRRVFEEHRDDLIIIGGEWNARIGEEGGNDEEGWNVNRRSKKKKN